MVNVCVVTEVLLIWLLLGSLVGYCCDIGVIDTSPKSGGELVALLDCCLTIFGMAKYAPQIPYLTVFGHIFERVKYGQVGCP